MRLITMIATVLLCTLSLRGAEISWQSASVGGAVVGSVLVPATQPSSGLPVIVYLKNLATPRVGQEPDDTILADFVKQGQLVLVLDYAHHAKAISPYLNADLLKLRQEITDTKHPSLLGEYKIDVNHLFILAEGCRLARDVEFS